MSDLKPIEADCWVYIPRAGVIRKAIEKLPNGFETKNFILVRGKYGPWWLLNEPIESKAFGMESPAPYCCEAYMFRIDPDEDIKNEHTEDKPVEVYGY